MSSSIAYALDFDGVLCDSVGESSITSFCAAKVCWPHLDANENPSSPAKQYLLDAMRSIRPIVETGYENVLLARMALETDPDQIQSAFVQPVLNDWSTIKEQLLTEWDVNEDQLIQIFGSIRDKWIENDPESWVSANKLFPGVVDAINFATAPVYIITTKQTRFCKLLLDRNGVTNIPEDHIYGLGSGTKISVLKELIKNPDLKGKSICFVEDRYETLEKVSISMLGQPLQLYLAMWGYNTAETKKTAEKHPFIQLLDLPTFITKFQ